MSMKKWTLFKKIQPKKFLLGGMSINEFKSQNKILCLTEKWNICSEFEYDTNNMFTHIMRIASGSYVCC